MAANESRIDINAVIKCLESCLRDDNIHLPSYLEAYRAIYRFFCCMGSIYTVMGHEVISKIKILDKHRQSDTAGHHYLTVASMLAYEEQTNRLRSSEAPSGARTLLKLHSAGPFIRKALKGLAKLEDDEPTGPMAISVYDSYMAKHNIMLAQQAAHDVMNALPDLKCVVTKTTIHTTDEYRSYVDQLTKLIKRVTEKIDDFYKTHKILTLP